MTELVANIWGSSRNSLISAASGISSSYSRARALAPTRDIVILGLFLSTLQILDGLLTGIGMYHFGTSAEGNMLLRLLMENFGFVNALLVTKCFAILVIAMLCSMSASVSWIKTALRCIIFIYLGAAIIPWSAILLTRVIL